MADNPRDHSKTSRRIPMAAEPLSSAFFRALKYWGKIALNRPLDVSDLSTIECWPLKAERRAEGRWSVSEQWREFGCDPMQGPGWRVKARPVSAEMPLPAALDFMDAKNPWGAYSPPGPHNTLAQVAKLAGHRF
jgi:hypothetical protein